MRLNIVLSICLVAALAWVPGLRAQETQTVTVEASSPAVDSGVDFQSGDFVHIRATGSWTPSLASNASTCGPEGSSIHAQWYSSRHLTSSLLVPSAQPMTLVGRIGEEGSWFVVGKTFEKLLSGEGRLYLAANDIVVDDGDAFADNGGSVEVEITITRSGGPVPESSHGLFPVVVRVVSKQDGLGVEGVSGYVLGPFTQGIPAVCQTNAAALARSAQSKVTTGEDLAVAGAREDSVQVTTGNATASTPVVFDGIDMSDLVNRNTMPVQMYYPSWRGMFVTDADGVGQISLLPGVYAVYLVGPDKSVTMVSGTVAKGQTNGWDFQANIKVERKEITAEEIYEYAWLDVETGKVWCWAKAKISGPVQQFNMINRVWSQSDRHVDVPSSYAREGWNAFSVSVRDLGFEVEDLLYATAWINLRVGAFFDSDGKVKETNEDDNMLIRDKEGPGVKMWWDHEKLWQLVESRTRSDWE